MSRCVRTLSALGLFCLAPAIGLSCGVNSEGLGESPGSQDDASSGADATDGPMSDRGGSEADGAASDAGGDAVDAVSETSCDATKAPWEDGCVIDDAYGIFVSSSQGSDATGTGTKVKPYRTLGKALGEAANGTKKRVYACAETFVGAVTMPSGVALFGALDCASLPRWTHTDKHATVKAAAGELAAFKVEAASSGVRIAEVDFEGADASAPGGSSLGGLIDNAGVRIERAVLTAGKGAGGAAAPSKPVQATSGTTGNRGKDGVCGGDGGTQQSGGDLVATSCGPESSQSGTGGMATLNANGGDGIDGTPTITGSTPPKDGLGGAGGKINGSSDCAAGHDGANGLAGTPGTKGTGVGTFTAGNFVPVDGKDGSAGSAAQGGGGGGASAGASGCLGASGASGGSGGCGGALGVGGKGGGASIALVVLGSTGTVVLVDVTLNAVVGGNGMAGQEGGDGGNRGNPGLAANGVSTVKDSCQGGYGGHGGKGGSGAGGNGGPSVGLWWSGMVAPDQAPGSSNVKAVPGAGGSGGPSADGIAPAGDNGIAAGVHQQ